MLFAVAACRRPSSRPTSPATRFVVPASQREHYGEALVVLPDSYYVNDRRRGDASPVTRAEAGLPPGGFVFCCFNQTYKILPDAFRRWMRIMAEVPGSLLWLLDTNRWARDNLRREAETRGLDPARLIVAGHAALADHLARQPLADLFLDTLPFNAGTTCNDALFMGVPVLTQAGHSFAARMAASLLHAMDLPELVCATQDDYVAQAVALAADPARQQALRARVQQQRDHGRLFDTARFTHFVAEALSVPVASVPDICAEKPISSRL